MQFFIINLYFTKPWSVGACVTHVLILGQSCGHPIGPYHLIPKMDAAKQPITGDNASQTASHGWRHVTDSQSSAIIPPSQPVITYYMARLYYSTFYPKIYKHIFPKLFLKQVHNIHIFCRKFKFLSKSSGMDCSGWLLVWIEFRIYSVGRCPQCAWQSRRADLCQLLPPTHIR